MISSKFFVIFSGMVLLFCTKIFSIEFEAPQLLSETDYSSEGKATIVDWDGDGLVDLLLGERIPSSEISNTIVTIWKNSGTATIPAFAKDTSLNADGSPINVECG